MHATTPAYMRRRLFIFTFGSFDSFQYRLYTVQCAARRDLFSAILTHCTCTLYRKQCSRIHAIYSIVAVDESEIKKELKITLLASCNTYVAKIEWKILSLHHTHTYCTLYMSFYSACTCDIIFQAFFLFITGSHPNHTRRRRSEAKYWFFYFIRFCNANSFNFRNHKLMYF